MKIRIEVDEEVTENEVIVKCRELTEEVLEFQKMLSSLRPGKKQITFYKGETQYYLSLDEILFFETNEDGISGHTRERVYQVKYKLYELEELLPIYFMRVSKSTILNINCIYAITRNISASSVVEFQNTHKTVYVSRYYYKALKNKLKEKRK